MENVSNSQCSTYLWADGREQDAAQHRQVCSLLTPVQALVQLLPQAAQQLLSCWSSHGQPCWRSMSRELQLSRPQGGCLQHTHTKASSLLT